MAETCYEVARWKDVNSSFFDGVCLVFVFKIIILAIILQFSWWVILIYALIKLLKLGFWYFFFKNMQELINIMVDLNFDFRTAIKVREIGADAGLLYLLPITGTIMGYLVDKYKNRKD